MRQSNDLEDPEPLSPQRLKGLVAQAIRRLDVNQVRKEVEPFVKTPESLQLWSHDFFRDVDEKIRIV